MAIGFIVIVAFVREPQNREKCRNPIEIIEAQSSRLVLISSSIALDYNFGFFTIFAYTPLALSDITTEQLWGTHSLCGVLRQYHLSLSPRE